MRRVKREDQGRDLDIFMEHECWYNPMYISDLCTLYPDNFERDIYLDRSHLSLSFFKLYEPFYQKHTTYLVLLRGKMNEVIELNYSFYSIDV